MAIHRLHWNQPAPDPCRGAVLSIGNFDGVHRGHLALLARLKALGQSLKAPTAAMTFDPHPLQLLAPERFEPVLTTLEERCRRIQAAGVDHVVVLQTEPELLMLSARQFFQQVIVENLRGRGLVEGPNFGFGRGREGNVELLACFCKENGLHFEVVQPLHIDSVMVSSSRIRQALQTGDVATANRWLGRHYGIEGVVGTGQRRGQRLGFPTANLSEVPTLIPGDGVYAVRAWECDSVRAPALSHAPTLSPFWPAAANLGPNPTFGEQARKVEVHLIGFQGDLYGRTLRVEFLARLRDTRRFDSVDGLLNQLRKDVERAQMICDGVM